MKFGEEPCFKILTNRNKILSQKQPWRKFDLRTPGCKPSLPVYHEALWRYKQWASLMVCIMDRKVICAALLVSVSWFHWSSCRCHNHHQRRTANKFPFRYLSVLPGSCHLHFVSIEPQSSAHISPALNSIPHPVLRLRIENGNLGAPFNLSRSTVSTYLWLSLSTLAIPEHFHVEKRGLLTTPTSHMKTLFMSKGCPPFKR